MLDGSLAYTVSVEPVTVDPVVVAPAHPATPAATATIAPTARKRLRASAFLLDDLSRVSPRAHSTRRFYARSRMGTGRVNALSRKLTVQGQRPDSVAARLQGGDDVANGDRDDHHQRRDQEAVEALHAQRPEDDPDAEARCHCEDQAHSAANPIRVGRDMIPPRRRTQTSAAASARTISRTSFTGLPDSAAARTSRLPTITPCAPASAAAAACSGVAIPKPTATGTSVLARARPITAARSPSSAARSPV